MGMFKDLRPSPQSQIQRLVSGEEIKPLTAQETANYVGLSCWAWPNGTGMVADVTAIMQPDYVPPQYFAPITGKQYERIIFEIPGDVPFPDWGYLITVNAPGYQEYQFRIDPSTMGVSYDIQMIPTSVIPSFTRDEVCGSKVTLSGLTIDTQQYGRRPWFELCWQCLEFEADRKSVLAQKKALGDTAQIIEFYTHAGQIYPSNSWINACITRSGESDPNWFKNLVREILEAGLVPWVVYDGDNGEDPTNGYPNALRQLPIVTNVLSEYNDKILYCRFWDGVFYGTTPEQIQNFGTQFRKILPNGYLAIEHQPGRIPVGNGPDDYLPDGMMRDYDVVVGEFNWPNYKEDSTWQVIARMCRPYHRPSDQPSGDDPNPPFYLIPCIHGQRYYKAMELGEYEWVRDRVSLSDLKSAGDYFRQMGATGVGLP